MLILLLRTSSSNLPALCKILPFLLPLGMCLGKIHNLHAQEPLKIFIYAGQSNAEGRAASLEDIPTGTDDSEILFSWNIQAASNFLAEGWDTLQPVPRLNSSSFIHAGEIAFGRKLYAAGLVDIGIIKVTKSGTSLDVPWNSTYPRTSSLSGTGDGGMYWLMVNYVESKLAYLDSLGIPYELEALIWHQGEADTNPVRAPRYEANFQNFVDSIQVHLSPDIELYAASIYNPSRQSSDVALVRQAQETVAINNSHVHFVDMDSIYFDSNGDRNEVFITNDGIHYKTPGYFKVGDFFSAAYLEQNPVISCDTIVRPDAYSQLLINATPTSDCGVDDGTISLSGNVSGLVFSINGGLTFQDTTLFSNLSSGNYFLTIQDEQRLGCKISYPNNPVVVEAPAGPAIDTVEVSEPSTCGANDGMLLITAQGSQLTYRLGNQPFQTSNQFIGLTPGIYTVYVREDTIPGCLDSTNVTIPFSSDCVPVECLSPLNLALGATASQSTTKGDGLASFAVDGNVMGDDNWGDDADMTHTETQADAWWKVDLGESYLLDSISIYNRTDTRPFILGRLSDFYVFVSSGDIDGNRPTADLLNDPQLSSIYFPGPAGGVEGFSLGTQVGRFLLIKLTGSGPLHMAEVEIYGCENSPPVPCTAMISEVMAMDRSDCEAIDGSIQIEASGNALEYSIDGGSSFSPTASFSGLVEGTYEVVVREMGDTTCSVSYVGNPVVVSVPSPPAITSVQITDASSCGSDDGAISIAAVGEVLEYSIDGGLYYQISPDFPDLPQGFYDIFVRELGLLGCETFYTNNPVEVSDNSDFSIEGVSFSEPSDCNLEDGSIEIQAIGSSLTYSIDGGQSFQVSPSFTGLAAGSFDIVVRPSDQADCEQLYVGNPILLQTPVLPQIQLVEVQDLTDCGIIDGRIEITATGDNLEYSIDGGLSFQGSPIFSGLSSGSYEVIVNVPGTQACSVSSDLNPISLDAPSLPTIQNVSGIDPSGCASFDGSITVTASGVNLVYSLDGIVFQASPIFSGLTYGSYTVYVREQGFEGCLETGSLTLLEPEGCGVCIPGNLALEGTASQSSTRGDGLASFAIDGDLIGDDNWGADANMSHTETVANSWWKVDLGVEATLDSVVIYNRTTSQTFLLRRLRDFYLFISTVEIDGNRAISELSSDPLITTQFSRGTQGKRR